MIPRSDIEAYLKPLAPLPAGVEPRGRLNAPLKSVLFDIYGTLLISGSGDIGVARQQAEAADIDQLLRERERAARLKAVVGILDDTSELDDVRAQTQEYLQTFYSDP